MVGFQPCPVREPEAVEDLQATALQAVSLTGEDLSTPFVNDANIDAATRHPGRRQETGRAGAHDETAESGLGR